MNAIHLISAHTLHGIEAARVFGFYLTEEAARDAVERDLGGMREALYDHLVIESVAEGVHGGSEVVQWYRWKGETVGDAKLWEECAAPAWADGLTGLGGVG